MHAAHARSELAVPAETTRSPGTQSDHAEHTVTPAADHVPAAHGVHAVAPVPSAEKVPAGQALHSPVAGSMQLVLASQGLPAPSQLPALQVSVVVQLSASSQMLPVVGPQVPSTAAPAATLHAWQSLVPPPHALAQQTPSVQKPLTHSAAAVQAAPLGRPRSSLATKTSLFPALVV